MPPLLPEYLSQPVQVAVQSIPPTEWWPVWVAAGATLVGSFGGALVGGRVAYKSAVKANDALLRRQRLEEALSIVSEIEDEIKPAVGSIVADADIFGADEVCRIKCSAEKISFSHTMRLRTLLEVYKRDLVMQANLLHVRLVTINSSANQVHVIKKHSCHDLLISPGLDFIALHGRIKESLIEDLR